MDDLRQAVAATRSNAKASMRSLRSTLQFLADLDERLTALEKRTAEEAKRNGSRGSLSEDLASRV